MSQDANPLIGQRVTYQSSLKIKLIVLNICLSSFYFGYGVVYLGTIDIKTIVKVFGDGGLSQDLAKGLLNGCIPIGALFGSLSSSFFIARFSRRNSLLIINTFAFLVGGLVIIESFPLLIFSRLSQGFCVGFYSAIAPLIVKELSPTEISGTLGSYCQLFTCLGVFFGSIFAYALKKIYADTTGQKFWRIQFLFPEITIALQTFVLLFVFPYETPKYLLSKGQEQQAKKLIQFIYKAEYVDEILEQKKNDLQTTAATVPRRNDTTVVDSSIASEQAAIGSSSKITAIIAIHLAVMQQFSGINGVVVYAGPIAEQATTGQIVLLMGSLINFEQVLATFITSQLLTKFGRRTILLYGAIFEGIALGLVTLGFYVKQYNNQAGVNLVLIGLFLFMAVFGLSLGPVVWLYIPEIVQPKIVSYSTAANWITASLVIILFPVLPSGPLFIFFTVWTLGSAFFNYLYVLETKDKTEKAIRSQYANKQICG